MEAEEFEKLVREGIEEIPKKFLGMLENVDIVVEEEPTSFQKRKLGYRKNSLILGLYEGIPRIKRANYAQVLPDKITIFKNSIEQVASSRESIKKIVRETVWHEIAHHFGLSEEEIRRKERKRG